MAKDNAKPTFMTPKVVARTGFVGKPSPKYGTYSIKIAVEEGSPEHEEIKKIFEEQIAAGYDEAIKNLKPAQKKKLVDSTPFQIEEDEETGDETGYLTCNFKMKAEVTRKKDGKKFFFKPDVFDAEGNKITGEALENLSIGNGTTVKVAFAAHRVYCMEVEGPDGRKFFKTGLSVDLKAVQIIDHVPFEGSGGASAESYGFGQEEGSFSAPATSDFDDEYGDAGDAPDGDF